jgi:hypothetical protein
MMVLTIVSSAHAQQQTFRIFGYLEGRTVSIQSPPSWLTGGFGRFGNGAIGATDHRNLAEAAAQLGAEWTPSKYFDTHIQGLGRTQASGARGRAAGIAEAYVDGRAFFGSTDEVQLRAGQFFLPTSRENKEELWMSPYTITWSALNTWIGEEVRPVGLDLQWKHGFYITAGVTAFRDNDTMGTLLAWRGWAVGNRLSVYDEVLPLPPLESLVHGDFTGKQRADGTRPFERDLDGRTGFSERIRFSLPERANIQLTHLDNRGDRRLYRGEYSWATKYDQVSAEVGNNEGTILAAEYMTGTTGMGQPQFAHVDIGFTSGYVLVSSKRGRWRTTLRAERFSTSDHVDVASNEYGESGHAYTAVLLYEPNDSTRAAIEYMKMTGARPSVSESGGNPSLDGRTVTLELRHRF